MGKYCTGLVDTATRGGGGGGSAELLFKFTVNEQLTRWSSILRPIVRGLNTLWKKCAQLKPWVR